ncbi:MAG: sialate O-acetylesterase, partial [Verrucomicrobiota bacterium]
MKKCLIGLLFWCGWSLNGWAELKLAALFSDHVVLQCDRAVPVWGWADAGSDVTVKFAGQEKTATAGPDGRWMVKLEPMDATKKGRSMTIMASKEKTRLTLQDVVVGEVWICSGQSNMAWIMKSSMDPDLEIPAANYPNIRLFSVTRKAAGRP